LFRKECFNQKHFSTQDPDEIIPEEYHNRSIKFKAFRPIVELNSDQYKRHNVIFKLKCNKFKDFFDNDLGKSPLDLQLVPLPWFTVNNISEKKVDYNFFRIINFLWMLFIMLFIPRRYRIVRKERHKLSPFSRMVLYENSYDIYDNPAIEAVINFRWQKTKNFFLLLFIRFFIFAICFGIVSLEYLNHNSAINGKSLVVLFVIFYYLTAYQLITEAIQFWYRGTRRYFCEIYSIFDLISIVPPVIVMSIMIKNFQLSDGFSSIETVDTILAVGIPFSTLILWIEFVSLTQK
jgi:hypothetical protein